MAMLIKVDYLAYSLTYSLMLKADFTANRVKEAILEQICSIK